VELQGWVGKNIRRTKIAYFLPDGDDGGFPIGTIVRLVSLTNNSMVILGGPHGSANLSPHFWADDGWELVD